ncbi:MAG: 7-carboxy-7-deazaguanine synthase [Sphingomonadales bacterium]
MTYSVKELFLTLQGEGAQTGRRAVFCRFAGCNLWTGREEDRADAVCQFCDTDFIGTDGPGGGKFKTPEALAKAAWNTWSTAHAPEKATPYIVCPGGEPMLQLDEPLIAALHAKGFEIAIETNGTLPVPPSVDWICVSPKAGADLVQRTGNELKLVYRQDALLPDGLVDLEFNHFFLQPMDGPNQRQFTQEAITYCLANPQWRLSLQTHKILDIA